MDVDSENDDMTDSDSDEAKSNLQLNKNELVAGLDDATQGIYNVDVVKSRNSPILFN